MKDEVRLQPELMQAMFYGSDNQILSFENIKGCIESFLFENLRTEISPSASGVRHNLAGNVIASLMKMGFSDLQKRIKKATRAEKEKLVDQQVAMISEAVAFQLLKSKMQPEKMMLEKLHG
jgi:hypothetical protein